MVVGDLGLVEMADAHLRLHKKLRPSDDEIPVCTANYRPPDVTLGSQNYQEDLDMWSFGCAAAEIYSRQILIAPAATAKQAPSPSKFVDAIAETVLSSQARSRQSCPASWLDGTEGYRGGCVEKRYRGLPVLTDCLIFQCTRLPDAFGILVD